MIKIGRLFLGSSPKIAAVITNSSDKKNLKKSIEHGADLLELRIDFFKDIEPAILSRAIKGLRQYKIPLIATIRSRKEGGNRALSDRQRLDIFRHIIPYADGVDIELSSKKIIKDIVSAAKKSNKKVIVSYHNFRKTPDARKLNRIIQEGKRAGADIVKIAAMAKDMNDMLRLAELTLKHKNLIIISMGELAKISRVFFPIMGSFITYGTVSESSAPGQMPLKILKRELNLYKP